MIHCILGGYRHLLPQPNKAKLGGLNIQPCYWRRKIQTKSYTKNKIIFKAY